MKRFSGLAAIERKIDEINLDLLCETLHYEKLMRTYSLQTMTWRLVLVLAALASVALGEEEKAPAAPSLDEKSFKDLKGPHFIMFYAPW